MTEQRDRDLGPMEPLRPAITDHAFVLKVDSLDPLGQFCAYPDPDTGGPCHRAEVEHVRSWR
jgi:hypothetical protein